MFSQNSFDFSKGHYLMTSNESVNRKEDRMVNRELSDPYKLEKKIVGDFDREEYMKKFHLTTLPIDSFKMEKTNPRLNYEYNDDENYELNSYLRTRNELDRGRDNPAYNNEMNYYKEMIEQMHNEIGSLNSKLTDLQKNNNLNNLNNLNNQNIQINKFDKNLNENLGNFSRLSNKSKTKFSENSFTDYSTSNISTANFRKEKVNDDNHFSNYNLENLKHVPKGRERSPSPNFITNLKGNKNDLVNGKSYLDNFESNLTKQTDKINNFKIPSNEIDKNKFSNKQIYKRDKLNTLDNKENKNKKTIPSKNSSKENRVTRKESKLPNGSKTNSISNSKSKKVEKTNSTSKKKSVLFKPRNKEELETLHNENEELRLKVNKLEQSLKIVNDNYTLDNIERKGKDYLRVELEIWKNRSETISKSYLETISNLKKQLLNEKTYFLDQIKTMQSTCTSEINLIKNKYQTNMERLENQNKNLKIKNEELKKKVSKVKEILTPNKI